MGPKGSESVPESNNGALLTDVTLGLVLGGLSSSHPVQDRQPHHGLWFQPHPVQEKGCFDLWFVVGLQHKGKNDRG